MADDLLSLIPRHKSDLERARAAAAAGYPKVAPILPQLFTWIQDCNWPVASVLCPLFVSTGRPILDEIRRVLETDDGMWKYWALHIAKALPPEIRADLHPDLCRVVRSPTRDEAGNEVVEVAREILDTIPPKAC